MLTEEDIGNIKKNLKYDPVTGFITFVKNVKNAEAITECSLGYKYKRVTIDGENYYSHRLAFVLTNGHFPVDMVDHINRNGLDNRWCNLREVTNQENLRNQKRPKNNTSGALGVYWRPKRGKWVSQIFNDGKCIFLGHFDNIFEAYAARKTAEIKYGFHKNHGVDNLNLHRVRVQD